jgi:dihydrofolate synthase/folylpolyglutamate synthase
LPFVGDWYLSQSDDPRAMAVELLTARLTSLLPSPPVSVTTDLGAALDAVEGVSEPGDCVLLVGSFTTVAAGLRHLERAGASDG